MFLSLLHLPVILVGYHYPQIPLCSLSTPLIFTSAIFILFLIIISSYLLLSLFLFFFLSEFILDTTLSIFFILYIIKTYSFVLYTIGIILEILTRILSCPLLSLSNLLILITLLYSILLFTDHWFIYHNWLRNYLIKYTY